MESQTSDTTPHMDTSISTTVGKAPQPSCDHFLRVAKRATVTRICDPHMRMGRYTNPLLDYKDRSSEHLWALQYWIVVITQWVTALKRPYRTFSIVTYSNRSQEMTFWIDTWIVYFPWDESGLHGSKS